MPMKQDLTASYIKELYRERKNNKNCIDNFSVAHYQEYLSKNGFGNKRNEQSYIKYKNLKNSSREKFTKHHKITGLIGYTWAFLRNKLVRQSIITDWKIRKAVKSLNS